MYWLILVVILPNKPLEHGPTDRNDYYGTNNTRRRFQKAIGRGKLDAAVLAANYSKAARSGSVGVNLCRARQVSKPAGAKPGLVQLSGDVRTLRLNWRNEKRRLERLRDALEG